MLLKIKTSVIWAIWIWAVLAHTTWGTWFSTLFIFVCMFDFFFILVQKITLVVTILFIIYDLDIYSFYTLFCSGTLFINIVHFFIGRSSGLWRCFMICTSCTILFFSTSENKEFVIPLSFHVSILPVVHLNPLNWGGILGNSKIWFFVFTIFMSMKFPCLEKSCSFFSLSETRISPILNLSQDLSVKRTWKSAAYVQHHRAEAHPSRQLSHLKSIYFLTSFPIRQYQGY